MIYESKAVKGHGDVMVLWPRSDPLVQPIEPARAHSAT